MMGKVFSLNIFFFIFFSFIVGQLPSTISSSLSPTLFHSSSSFSSLSSSLLNLQDCGSEDELYFGAHHKTGSRLIETALGETTLTFHDRYSSKPEEWSDKIIKFKYHSHSNFPFPLKGKFFHMIRDPFEIVASGFLYHKRDPGETWIQHKLSRSVYIERCSRGIGILQSLCDEIYPSFKGKKTWVEVLNDWPTEKAVFFEAMRATKDHLETINTFRHIKEWNEKGCVLNFDLKRSQKNFTDFENTFFDFIGLTDPEDKKLLHEAFETKGLNVNHAREEESNEIENSHVSSQAEEDKIVKILQADSKIATLYHFICKETNFCHDFVQRVEEEGTVDLKWEEDLKKELIGYFAEEEENNKMLRERLQKKVKAAMMKRIQQEKLKKVQNRKRRGKKTPLKSTTIPKNDLSPSKAISLDLKKEKETLTKEVQKGIVKVLRDLKELKEKEDKKGV